MHHKRKFKEESGHHPHRGRRGHHGRPRWGKFRRAGFRRPKYNVPVNIIENADYFEAWVYCISFAKEDITINVVDDMLYISGKRTPKVDAPNFLLQEYPIKGFERMFELSEKVDQEQIKARFEDSILKIHVPKMSATQRGAKAVEID